MFDVSMKDKSLETPRQSQGLSRPGRGIPPGLIGVGKRGRLAQSARTFRRIACMIGTNESQPF